MRRGFALEGENMKIEREKAMLAMVNFVEQNILSQMKGEVHKWVLGGLLPVMPQLVGRYMDSHNDALCMMGIVDGDGCVDTERARAMFDSAFRVQPTLPVKVKDMMPDWVAPFIREFLSIDITFTKKDADTLIQMAES